MKTGLPQYKKELAKSFIKSVEFNRRGRYSRKHGQRKTINNKGKELKEILRPLLNINTKRPRSRIALLDLDQLHTFTRNVSFRFLI